MAGTFLQGLDVSHFDGTIDWAQVAGDPSSPKFAYAKASEGSTFDDRCFTANYAGIKANNMLCGAYHYFHPEQPAQAQADWFMNIVREVKGDLPPMLDVERAGASGTISKAEYAAALQQWLELVAQGMHCTPIIYTRANFWNENVGDFGAFAGYPLWIAEYCSASKPILPEGATSYAFWQYSQQGGVAGINSAVDLDRFNGTQQQLQALLCTG